MQIDMPSGLVVEARKILGEECKKLAERSEQNSGSPFARLMANCWVSTVEPGPYRHIRDGAAHDWNKVLTGDLDVAIMRLRVASVARGDRFQFPVQCEACDARYDWEISIEQHVLSKIKRLPDESRATLAAGEDFAAALLDGRGVRFQLLTGESAERLQRFMKQIKRRRPSIVEEITAQIVSVDGLKSNDIRTVHGFVSGLNLEELTMLKLRFDEAGCGFDPTIVSQCLDCARKQDVQLPFGRNFFIQTREILLEDATPPPT